MTDVATAERVIVCKRKGCTKRVGPVARSHGDPYCSTVCCRIERGLNPKTAGPIDAPDPLADWEDPPNEG